MTTFVIYGLFDPRTTALRYVGMSKVGPARARDHLRPSHMRRRTASACWVRALAAAGLRPASVVLEYVPTRHELPEAERRWIRECRAAGADLLNLTDGGEGMQNPTAEVRERLAAAVRGTKRPPRSPEWCARLSAALRGAPRPSPTSMTRLKKKLVHVGRSRLSIDEIVQRHVAGESVRSLEVSAGVSRGTLSKWIREAGAEVRERVAACSARSGTSASHETRAKLRAAWVRRKARTT